MSFIFMSYGLMIFKKLLLKPIRIVMFYEVNYKRTEKLEISYNSGNFQAFKLNLEFRYL